MEIRDPLHGHIPINPETIPIIEAPFFQRLRNIKQLGFSEYVFPGATHTRFLHSIGVLAIATKAFKKIFEPLTEHKQEIARIRETFKLAALLHDIGHAPLSHSTESVMPKLGQLNIPSDCLSKKDQTSPRQATHEDYTIKAIVDSSFSDSLTKTRDRFGVEHKAVASLITGHCQDEAYFTISSINYFPILHQLISSEMDCDRMDYLQRDSYFCGVSYGKFDLDWIINNLEVCHINQQAFLGISEKAISTFDDFLLGRYHMFLMVYFHYRPVCLEQLLSRYFSTAKGEYNIPPDIESYQRHDDNHLMQVLRSSQNQYAKNIIKNKIPDKVYECYGNHSMGVIQKLEKFVESKGYDSIISTSSGRLSKYYNDLEQDCHKFPIQVIRKIHGPNDFYYRDIQKATDLFTKFSNTHTVSRFHCELEKLSTAEISELNNIIQTEEALSNQSDWNLHT